MSEPSTTDDFWESFVNSAAFDKECAVGGRREDPSPDHSYSDYTSTPGNVRETDSPSSAGETSESAPHYVSKVDAHLYYYGIRGFRWGPKLIFRMSKDVFHVPQGPAQDVRCMQLLPVYEHQQLGKDDLWAVIRSKRNIQHSSIDLVRFRWVEGEKNEIVEEHEDIEEDSEVNEDVEENEDFDANTYDENDYDDDYKVPPYGTVVTTPVTIWVGVLPDTLTSEVAFHSSNDILDLLKEHSIFDVDVAYRESVARGFNGAELFAPVSDYDPLKAVIDPVTTSLGLPIAGLTTLMSQGTMGFFFRVGKALHAVTARHILFPEDQGNNLYSYREVVLMGTNAFANLLASIKSRIGSLNDTVGMLEERAIRLTEGSRYTAEQAAARLVEDQDKLSKARTAIKELKKFFVQIRKHWTKTADRVIGYVVWSPPISVSPAPHHYTTDICVIKLDEKKFAQNFRANFAFQALRSTIVDFIGKMYSRTNTSSDFEYPFIDRLLKLQGILSPEEIRTPNNEDRNGEPVRYVIKHGLATLTTIGRLNGFESHVRRYFAIGSRDSVEAAIFRYDSGLNSSPFSSRGDSGSIIVDGQGKYVALLTGGTGPTSQSDITYGSPMHWLWDVIKAQFPGADLSFEDDGT
ncbi:hypothetical protein M413DRAFT_25852 [Hebeloma cylindrosporum]|uniref:Uncharacterized protein n=1 Tax=Hebeloma cylindrosporum TaxID=76867 RepID=A0A0C3CH57_HEBCY|nr:hypothetical protein M413DRAFT_25852 [Hebeloma cylindrosporum h7]